MLKRLSSILESSPAAAAAAAGAASTEVAEGRHIKGDPLKGYYDFVITEGSYKFWAVFQVIVLLLPKSNYSNARSVQLSAVKSPNCRLAKLSAHSMR